ncbi:MAG: M14 family zinc carboxypeptidase, partial [Candidatus Kariarchaeaceae archaeon]
MKLQRYAIQVIVIIFIIMMSVISSDDITSTGDLSSASISITLEYGWIWDELTDPALPGKIYADDPVVWGSSLGPYYNTSETLAKVKAAELAFPSLVTYFEYGVSYLGNPLFGVKVTTPYNDEVTKKYETIVIGAHHAREGITIMDSLLFLDRLLFDYTLEAQWAIDLLNHAEVYIIPLFNPDGVDLLSVNPWQRKNLQPIDADNDGDKDELEVRDIDNDGYVSVLNENINGTYYYVEGEDLDEDGFVGEDLPGGVDLNRNYGFKFALDDLGSSDEPNWDNYRGSAAFSAPETYYFSEWAKKHH